MANVTIRDLRNHGREVIDRVLGGERLTVTRSGRPVAELRPLAPRGLDAATLLERCSGCRQSMRSSSDAISTGPRLDAVSDVEPPTRGLLDTNTVILLARLRDPQQLPPVPAIATVSLAELSVGPLVAPTEPERAARQAHLQQAEADFDPIPFDAAAARAFGQVAADLRRSGARPPPAPTTR